MAKAIFCIVNRETLAEDIINQLKEAGFRPDEISVLLPDTRGTRDFAHEHHTKAPEGTAAGVTTGGVVGGTLGWLAGIGALTIPGIGPFLAAGPIMAALSGVAIGGALGGLTGALVGMGIPEFEAKMYEGKIKGGNILISVHTENAKEADRAKEIFRDSGAHDIASSGEESVKAHR